MKKLIRLDVLGLLCTLALSVVVLSACQDQTASTTGRSTRTQEKKEIEIIVPMLKLKSGDSESNFQLRSQTSKYLSKSASKIELILTNHPQHSCQKPASELLENETLYRLTIETGSSAAFVQDQSYSKLQLVKQTSKGEDKIVLSPTSSVKVTSFNTSIFRGDLDLSSENFSLKGEFFTALCK